MMEQLILIVFALGYLAITLEHTLKVDKLIPALLMMALANTLMLAVFAAVMASLKVLATATETR